MPYLRQIFIFGFAENKPWVFLAVTDKEFIADRPKRPALAVKNSLRFIVDYLKIASSFTYI